MPKNNSKTQTIKSKNSQSKQENIVKPRMQTTKLIDPQEKTSRKPARLSNIISIIAIIASTTIGIISIINSNAIAKLDREIHAAVLEYDFRQVRNGELVFEVLNKGKATASNVVVNMIFSPEYDIINCTTYSPYQDTQPISPYPLNNNSGEELALTYRLSSIPVGSAFSFGCNIYETIMLESEDEMLFYLLRKYSVPLPSRLPDKSGQVPTSVATPGPFINCYTIRKMNFDDVVKWRLINIPLRDLVLQVEVFSDNSEPSRKIANLPNVSAWQPLEITKDSSIYDIEYCVTP